MASRIQGKQLGVGKAKQSNITTASATFLHFDQINAEIATPNLVTENDAPMIGKGNEFVPAGAVYPVSYDSSGSLDKFASSEWTAWAWCYALGNVVQTGSSPNYTYTVTPVDPGTTLELPYFSVVEQMAEGGGNSIDNIYVGCAIEEVMYSLTYGAGRATSKCTVSWIGSGLYTSPSTVTLPSLQTEHFMLGAAASVVINGVDYVANGRILSVNIGWKNNLMPSEGRYPGSGLQNGASVCGRIEYGPRTPSLSFTARLVVTSNEYAKLVAQTTGTAVVSVAYDANNSAQWSWTQVSYGVVKNGETNGIMNVTVTVIPQYTTSILTGVFKNTITGICQ